MIRLALLLLLLLTPYIYAWAWGPTAHELIAEEALVILKPQELRDFFIPNRFLIGLYSNAPDHLWKNAQDKQIVNAERSTHYFDADSEKDFQFIKLSFEDAAKQFPDLLEKEPYKNKGTLPWRIAQFYALTIEAFSAFEIPPTDSKDELKKVERLLQIIGLMSHYIGDAAQPLHTTREHTGFFKNSDQAFGLLSTHIYFESELVSVFKLSYFKSLPSIAQQQMTALKKQKKILPLGKKSDPPAIPDVIYSLLRTSFQDVGAVSKKDELNFKKSLQKSRGSTHLDKIKFKHLRMSQDTQEAYRPLILKHMGRGTAYLSYFIERAWSDAGRPALPGGYYVEKVSHTPDWIKPDYLTSTENISK